MTLFRSAKHVIQKTFSFRDSDDEIKIIQLRNPWGDENEWNKDWSDKDSKSWDSIRPDEKAKYFVGNVSK